DGFQALAGSHGHKAVVATGIYGGVDELAGDGVRAALLFGLGLLFQALALLLAGQELLVHILDLEIGQVAVLDGFREDLAGVGGVDVEVDDVVVLDADHAVAVGLGKGAHLGGAGPVLLVDQELGAVAVLDVLHLHQVVGKDAAAGVGGGQLGLVLGGLGGGDDALAVEHLAHALEDDQDALAPGVHHAGLFQDGQQVGGVVQGALAGGQDPVPQLVHVGDAAGPGLLRGDAGHRQDGALGGLHDGLIGGLDALFQGGDQVPGAGLFFAFQR